MSLEKTAGIQRTRGDMAACTQVLSHFSFLSLDLHPTSFELPKNVEAGDLLSPVFIKKGMILVESWLIE
jgi:hypothetical protein